MCSQSGPILSQINPLHKFPSCTFQVTFIINLPSRRTRILGARSLKDLTFVAVSNNFITFQNTEGTLNFAGVKTAIRQQVSPTRTCLHVCAICSKYSVPTLTTLPIQLPVYVITVPYLKYVFIISFFLLTSKYFLVGICSQTSAIHVLPSKQQTTFYHHKKMKRQFLYSMEYHYYVGSNGTIHHFQQQTVLLCSSAA